MWDNIVLELNYAKLYNFSFLNTASDMLISLVHWQYWWWFWFSFILCFYYVLLTKIFSTRLLKFFPKIVTSYRSHGKWGDIIVCFLPVSWCLNILSNSTTLLKLMEWQSESSLFTLRVRGKQWYWLYKIDISSFNNINNSCSLNIKVGKFSKSINNTHNLISSYTVKNNNFSKNINTNVFYDTVDNIYSIFENFSNNNLLKLDTSIFKNNNKLITLFSKDADMLNIFNITSNSLINYNTYTNSNTYFTKYFSFVQKRLDDWSKYNNLKLFNIDFFYDNFVDFDTFFNFLNSNNNRLLSVNNILILPTNIFINVITNSFDVIHSWFIPGLGMKMDCIPGRSTHHTLYIDNVGIFYGQCAEICGRFHHHMPIKICALNMDHFIMFTLHNNKNLFKSLNQI